MKQNNSMTYVEWKELEDRVTKIIQECMTQTKEPVLWRDVASLILQDISKNYGIMGIYSCEK